MRATHDLVPSSAVVTSKSTVSEDMPFFSGTCSSESVGADPGTVWASQRSRSSCTTA